MGKIISFANQKGGVGKTTSCVNIAASLGLLGYKVLIIDLDPQGNTTSGVGVSKKGLKGSTKELLTGEKPAKEIIVETPYENLSVIPTNTALAGAEFDLFDFDESEFRMKNTLAEVKDDYDYILIDAPPTLGGWVMNIMCAADYLIIPVEASPWGLFGLANMFEFFEQVRSIRPEIELLGIAITKADERKNYFKQTLATLRELEGVHLFERYIRVDSAVEWAQDNSAPVLAFRHTSRSAKEYHELTKEIIENVNR